MVKPVDPLNDNNLDEAAAPEVIGLVNRLLAPHGLTTMQEALLSQAWLGETYQDIAENMGYEDSYIRSIGAQLWQSLSDALEQKISKTNFRAAIQQQLITRAHHSLTAIEFPQGQVPLSSPLYIERPPIESTCHSALLQPGALLRIKAPKQMGKTSLMVRIVEQARNLGYATVTLNLELASSDVLADVNSFFQWFCTMVGKALNLPNCLDDYWEPVCGGSSNCTEYFEGYLLPKLACPLVLALDNIDALFSHSNIATDLSSMLRAWYESARYGDSNNETWQQLRLITVYSTEAYIPLNTHQSPFNVGIPIELPEFTQQQVVDLLERHKLTCSSGDIKTLLNLVGGNPYLVRLTLYHVTQANYLSLERIVETSYDSGGIYEDHLQKKFWRLQSDPTLLHGVTQLVKSPETLELSPTTLMKLVGLGLIRVQKGRISFRTQLYKEYFKALLETR